MVMARADWQQRTIFLSRVVHDEITLTWTELSEIVGTMPPSAIEHAAVWWSGDRPNTRGGRAAGFEVTSRELGVRVTFAPTGRPVPLAAAALPHSLRRSTPSRSVARREDNIAQLVEGFAEYVQAFEASHAFPGPSLYFHAKAIERRRAHRSAAGLLADDRFLEYVYAVLPAWGMHRMGGQRAKVRDFTDIVDRLRANRSRIEWLWRFRITTLRAAEAADVAATAWEVIADVRVSSSDTQIVAGSKMLHHLLPDLIPPIDRQYTFRFFTGQKAVAAGDRRAFLDWLPRIAEIGFACQRQIIHAMRRGGFMATGEAKIIDNAIMGFMQQHDR